MVGNENQAIWDSYNKIALAQIDLKFEETLNLLTEAVAAMTRELPKEQATEVTENLGKLLEKATKPKLSWNWYSVSIDGLIKATEI